MSTLAFEDRDNFIRNAVTVLGPTHGLGPRAGVRIISQGELPVPVEEILDDLRVDDPEAEEATVRRLAKGAAAFIARRTGYVLLPTVYEIIASSWWTGALEVNLGPLRSLDSVSYLASRDVTVVVDPDQVWASDRGRSMVIRFLEDFGRPDLWQQEDCVRLRFSAGFDAFDESGSNPIEDGLRTVLLMVTGHYYQNREMLGLADARSGLQAVELGAISLLGQYRQFW